MKYLYKLEKKYGKYAIYNLSRYIIACFIIGYLLWMFLPGLYSKLVYSPIPTFVNHEYWRLITWIFTMPGSINFFTLLMLFFYYIIGKSIERGMGTFMYNLYVFGGVIFVTLGLTIVGAIDYANNVEVWEAACPMVEAVLSDSDTLMALADSSPSYFMLTSIYLGFALIYSDSYVLLWYTIPFKVKWLAIIDLIMLGYQFATTDDMYVKTVIICSVLNFGIYFLIMGKYQRNGWRMPAGQLKRRRQFKQQVREAEIDNLAPDVAKHKCAICGKTEKDDFEMQFRFCSKCNGNYEYCSDHLFTHEHVK